MILDKIVRTKRVFNVDSKEDLESAKKFFQTYSWRHEFGCPFHLEEPHASVPTMMMEKLVRKFLKMES